MNLKKSFIVSLFILSSFSNANAVGIEDIVEELSSITKPTGIAFRLIEEDGELGDDRELSLTTKQEFCYNALDSALEGYEAEDYYLKSTDLFNEQDLYLLKFTHWTFNSEDEQDAYRPVSARASLMEATGGDDEEGETFSPTLSMDNKSQQQGKREHQEEDKDVRSPSLAVEEARREHQEDVRSQSLIVEEARMERPKKGLIMLWSITPEVNPSNQEQQDAYSASRAELKKASYVTSIRSFVDTVRQKNEDMIYFSEELSPSMHLIMKAMRLDTIKPNTGFTVGKSFGELHTVHHLQEDILS